MRRRRNLGQLVALVIYLCLISLLVQWMVKDDCIGGDTVGIIPTSGPILVPNRHSADEEAQSLVLAVRVDWDSHGFNTQAPSSSGTEDVAGKPTTHIKDIKPKRCQNMTYLRDLPKASLVVTFTSANVTVLFRGLQTLRNRTPGVLVADIILVHMPSHSQNGDKLRHIEDSVNSRYPDLIFLRSDPDEGVRGARMKGVQKAQGDVIVFLQMPSEVNLNWLPPLLDPLVQDKDSVTCPLTDVIDAHTLVYKAAKRLHGERKGFNWRFERLNFEPFHAYHSAMEMPYATPLLEEKAFAIRKSRYLEIEDSALSPQWKGGDIDLSLKIWLCGGGKILNVPCSRIGFMPKPPRRSITYHDAQNYRMIAHQWFQDFGKYVFFEIGRGKSLSSETNAKLLQIRERLICKPFQWFLEKIMPELPKQFPPYIPARDLGVIQSDLCRKCVSVKDTQLDSTLVVLHPCNDSETTLNYHIHLLEDGRLQASDGKLCLSLKDYGGIVYSPCSSLNSEQTWVYDSVSKTLMNEHTKRCLQTTTFCDGGYFPLCSNKRKPKDRMTREWLIAKHPNQLKPALNETEINKINRKRLHLS